MADIPDPGTGLTPKQKDAIRTSWAPVSSDMKTHGVALFIKLFKAYPAYKDLFPDFRGKTIEDLETSHHIRAHGTTVMFNLGGIINSLDDAECLARMIRKLGSNHFHQKVSMDQFQKLGPLIIELFQEALGAGFTAEMKGAWLQLYTVLLALVEEGMNTAKAS